jgi:hypothetical protein
MKRTNSSTCSVLYLKASGVGQKLVLEGEAWGFFVFLSVIPVRQRFVETVFFPGGCAGRSDPTLA